MKSIDVKCTGNDSKELEELIELQGKLKVLTDDNYSKLKKGIIELGFLEPVTIWRDRNEILNGHQRVTTNLPCTPSSLRPSPPCIALATIQCGHAPIPQLKLSQGS